MLQVTDLTESFDVIGKGRTNAKVLGKIRPKVIHFPEIWDIALDILDDKLSKDAERFRSVIDRSQIVSVK